MGLESFAGWVFVGPNWFGWRLGGWRRQWPFDRVAVGFAESDALRDISVAADTKFAVVV